MRISDWSSDLGSSDLMQKEIFEQPVVVAQTLGAYLRPLEEQVALPALPFDLAEIRRISIVACGTSYYAGMVAKYWIEHPPRAPVALATPSEFPHRPPPLAYAALAPPLPPTAPPTPPHDPP